jgi:hypothetical protein
LNISMHTLWPRNFIPDINSLEKCTQEQTGIRWSVSCSQQPKLAKLRCPSRVEGTVKM